MTHHHGDDLTFETVLADMKTYIPAVSAALLGECKVTHDKKTSTVYMECQHVIIFKWPNHECWTPCDVLTCDKMEGVSDLGVAAHELARRIAALSKVNTAKAYGRYLQFRYRKPLLDLAYHSYHISNLTLPPERQGRDWSLDEFKTVVLSKMTLSREEEVKIHAEIWKEFAGEIGTTRPPTADNPFIVN